VVVPSIRTRQGRTFLERSWRCILCEGHDGAHDLGGTKKQKLYTDKDIEAIEQEAEERGLAELTPAPVRPVPTMAIDAILTTRQLNEVLYAYSKFNRFSFDVETRANRALRRVNGSAKIKDKPPLDARTNEVWSMALAGPDRSDVIPMGHPLGPRQLTPEQVFTTLEPLFFSERRKINQNVGFDLLSIAKYYDGQIPPPPYGDVMTLAFLLDENLGRYNLGALTQVYHGFIYSEKLGEKAYTSPYREAIDYNHTDAKWAYMLWWHLHRFIRKPGREKLWRLFNLEMDVLEVLLDMRRTGAYVDLEGFHELQPVLTAQVNDLVTEIQQMVGWDDGCQCSKYRTSINLNSPDQIGHWLYDELGLRVPKLTDTGKRSTDADTLKVLARRRKEPRKLLEYKDINKLLSTYVIGFIPTIDSDSRIRASFNQAVAKTGRLSCSEPNLQNIPARWKEGFESTMIRKLFIAPLGKVLIVADYSQIELRILAHQTQDPKLLYAYTHGEDLHRLTASLIWRVPMDQVTTEQRAIAKNSNFNFAFEGGPGRVVAMSGISLEDAQDVYDGWHRAYPGVKRWGKQVKRDCLRQGWVETLYGRKRRLEEIRSSDMRERSYAERQAVNHPIQGTAADIAKVALVEVRRVLRAFDAHLTLQVHDEFVIECSKRQVDDVIPLIKEAMENIQLDGHPVLRVPLEVNIGVGSNWSEAK